MRVLTWEESRQKGGAGPGAARDAERPAPARRSQPRAAACCRNGVELHCWAGPWSAAPVEVGKLRDRLQIAL